MKKYINNKVYDTETATWIADVQCNQPGSLDYYTEDLYVKRTGEYFLRIEGGANTKAAKMLSANTWQGDTFIKPITYKEAEEWAQEYCDSEDYDKYFGEIKDDESQVVIYARVSAKAADLLEKQVSVTGKTKAQIVEDLLLTLS